ncbi:MAG: DedA family protein [Bdellovibrionales bacterium]
MSLAEQPIFQFLSQYAYEPQWVYLAVVGMMLASGFGFPLPEEVTLISVGVLAFMGSRPDLFPPPPGDVTPVNMHHAAIVAFLAVMMSDFLIYAIGRLWGRRILYHPRMRKLVSEESLRKVEAWTHRYGMVAVFVFRFTPGVRFPGHLVCGIMKLKLWKFLSVDGFAAAISVPTQIYLLAIYGEPILKFLQEVKLFILGLAALGFVVFALRRFWIRRTSQSKA